MDRDDFAVDLEELFNDIDNAEVVSISFPTFDRSAVFDMRINESEGPMLRLMPMVSSPRERIRSVRRLRPGFPRASGLTVIPWHGYVDTLVQTGIWGKLVERFSRSGSNHRDALDTCDSVLRELRQCEKSEMTAAILGDNYHTIWTSRN